MILGLLLLVSVALNIVLAWILADKQADLDLVKTAHQECVEYIAELEGSIKILRNFKRNMPS